MTCSANKPSAAVDNGAGQVLAAHAFGFEHRADFPAGVAGVKLVHDVAERGKIIIAFQTVHTVIDGDQPDTALPQNLHDLTDFQIDVYKRQILTQEILTGFVSIRLSAI